jgi:hypothetical protein
MLLRFFRILVSCRQFRVDQILTVKSSPIVARYDPTGSQATPFTKLEWAVSTATACPSTTQMMTSVSRLHDARNMLSGDHASPVTPSLCFLQKETPSASPAPDSAKGLSALAQHCAAGSNTPECAMNFPVFDVGAIIHGAKGTAAFTS